MVRGCGVWGSARIHGSRGGGVATICGMLLTMTISPPPSSTCFNPSTPGPPIPTTSRSLCGRVLEETRLCGWKNDWRVPLWRPTCRQEPPLLHQGTRSEACLCAVCAPACVGWWQVDEVVGAVAERFGKVDGVANCVGSIVLKPAHQTSEAEFDQVGRVPCVRLLACAPVRAQTAMRQPPEGAAVQEPPRGGRGHQGVAEGALPGNQHPSPACTGNISRYGTYAVCAPRSGGARHRGSPRLGTTAIAGAIPNHMLPLPGLDLIGAGRQVIKLNLYSCFNIVKASAKRMMASGGGAIVLCSSAVAKHGIPNHEAIAAAKAGVVGG
jgi:NAD(P)-dependent dehydrogenase (short-subunit alcohol dehydrogenase family)